MENNGKRIELLRAVAAYIDGFEVKVPADGRQPRLAGPDGMEIFIATSRERGKLHIHGDWPTDGNTYMSPRSWGAVPYDENGDVSINVSEVRGPEEIARDILRRFLPQYREIYAKCCQRKAENAAYRDRLYVQAQAITKAAGLPAPGRLENSNSEYRLHLGNVTEQGWYGTVQVYDKSINLDLRGVTVANAEKILAILRTQRAKS